MIKRASTLVTGVAGFIGSFVAQRLLERGTRVVGLDDLNDYYDPELKRARLARLERFRADSQFIFERTNIVDAAAIERVFKQNAIESVVHLAAQAGVRHSITHPQDYIDSNLTGFLNMLQAVRGHPVRHFVYASSSSVYGGNTKLPFLGKRYGRSTRQSVRSNQACQRTDGVRLFVAIRCARDRSSIFHGVRTVGAAGYGDVQIHQGDRRR